MTSILGIDPNTKIVRMVGDNTKSERVFAAKKGFDIVTVSDAIARLAYGEKWPLAQTRYAVTVPQGWTPPSVEPEDSVQPETAQLANSKTINSVSMFSALFQASHQEPVDPDHRAAMLSANLIDQQGLTQRGQALMDQLNAPSLSDSQAEELVSIALAYCPPAAATYTELVQAINHCQTVNQVSALVNRITQHTPSTERQVLYALQNSRIEALKGKLGCEIEGGLNP